MENIKHGIPDANMLAQKILETLQHPIQLDSVTATISASIGISMHQPDDEKSADQLVSAADSAMYTAKHAGKAQVCIHK
ncbi:diguanylate cyclase domain-containing protein [Aeromonas caviae]|uniref:diguanylate cyclase domain-containing protein n=1 Tax=Aeromonas caviae TaxID=648 RepID=UPI003C6BE5DF